MKVPKIELKPRGKSAIFWVRYSFNGKREHYSLETADEAEAKKEAKRILNELELSIHRPRRKVIFDNLLEKYLKWAKKHKEASSYKRNTVSSVPLLKRFSGKFIKRITSLELEQYLIQRLDGDFIVEGYSKKTKLCKATVNHEAVLMKHMFKKALEWGYLKQNQLQHVQLFKKPGARIRYVTADEWQRLISASTPEPRDVFIFAANTGMRLGEIFNLQWTDVDWQERQVIIQKAKNNTPRIVPMNQVVHKLLLRRKQIHNSNYVFPGRMGKRRTAIRNAFIATCKRAGITNLRFHDLRHTFGTWLVNQGADIKTVQELMGHKCLVSTERYLHPNDEHKRKVIESITGMSEKPSPNLPQKGTSD